MTVDPTSLALLAFGSLTRAGAASADGKFDARLLRAQSRMAYAQGFADEQQQRRESRFQLGEQAASLAQAGIGSGGTGAMWLRESEMNAELDALNYRYRGLVQGRTLAAQAKQVKAQSRRLAGAQLISGAADLYNARSILSNAGG